MPTPKRWHPVSRDLNDDPELWDFTETFGDRYLRLWLEILSMIDKSENRWRVTGQWLASLSRKVRGSVATSRRAIDWLILNQWITVEERSADGSPLVFSSRNYWKFHKSREPKGAPLGSVAGPKKSLSGLPPNLSEPNLTLNPLYSPFGKGEQDRDGGPMTKLSSELHRIFKDKLTLDPTMTLDQLKEEAPDASDR